VWGVGYRHDPPAPIERPKIEPMALSARSDSSEAVAHSAALRSRDIDGATP
jgi:hypothetical protein